MSNNSSGLFSQMEYIQSILMHISIPYIIIVSMVGIPGNILTIIMLSKRSLTKNFNNCTLIALALSDLLFNLTLVSRCIAGLLMPLSYNFCRVLAFLSHLAELLSACFTVHFTVQRFVAVRFPLSVFIEKNIHLLHYCFVILFILSGVSYCLALVKYNVYEECEETLTLDWFFSDAVLSFAIPFTIIAILNVLIIFHLRKTSRNNRPLSFKKKPKPETLPLTRKRRASSSYDLNSQSKSLENLSAPSIKTSICDFSTSGETKDNFLSVSDNYRRTASIRSTTRAHAQSHRVTRMLIIVSTCFLILNAPSHIFSISLKLYTRSSAIIDSNRTYINRLNNSNETKMENLTSFPSTTSREIRSRINLKVYLILYIILIISHHIAYLSYSVNFFLYSYCGMKFRAELMKFLACYRKCQRRKENSRSETGQNSI